MFKKVFVFLKSDGLRNTLKYVINGISNIIGIKNSETILLSAGKDSVKYSNREIWNQVNIVTLDNAREIESLDFPRLKLVPYQQWFEKGSKCNVILKHGSPIAFGWIHFHQHSIDKVGTIDLGNSQAWLGPFFVNNKERGNGFQMLLIQECIKQTNKEILRLVTSVNSKNVPSLKSFENLGFLIVGKCLYKAGKCNFMSEPGQSNIIKIAK